MNNAGVFKFAPLEEVTEAEYQRQFGINVLGPLQATREALPLFGPEGGSVINISSIVSRMGIPGSAIYAGTKGALDTITQVLASELGRARSASIPSIRAWWKAKAPIPPALSAAIPEEYRSQGAAGPHRPAGRRRQGGGVPGQR